MNLQLDARKVTAVITLSHAIADLGASREASTWLGGAAFALGALELVRPLGGNLRWFDEGAAAARAGEAPEPPRHSDSALRRVEAAIRELLGVPPMCSDSNSALRETRNPRGL